MQDDLRTFLNEHRRILVYDMGIESIRLMSGLIKEGIITASFLIDDDIMTGVRMDEQIFLSMRVYSVSYIATKSDRSGIGIIVPKSVDDKARKLISNKTNINITDIYRDDLREVPECLYRYTSFRELETILDGDFCFSDPNRWDDKCEGYLYHALQDKKGRARIIEDYAQMYGAEKGEIKEKLQYIYENTKCKCLSGTEDSIVMWNAYAYNNEAVMIELLASELIQADKHIMIFPIRYVDDDISLFAEMKNVIKKDGIITHGVYTTKRKSFSYEDEYRVFFRCEYPNKNDVEKININPNVLIKNVMIHPKASVGFEQEVQRTCKMAGVNYAGKSKCLDFPV